MPQEYSSTSRSQRAKFARPKLTIDYKSRISQVFHAVTSRLRSYEIYPRPSTRTKRYCSLMQCGLSHYQKGLPTVHIYPSVSFYTCWRIIIQLLTVIIIIPITIIVLGLLLYITFLPFYLIVLIQTGQVSSFIVYVLEYVVWSSLLLLFSLCYFIFSYCCCKYVIKCSVQFSHSEQISKRAEQDC